MEEKETENQREIEVADIHRITEHLEVFLFNVGQGDHIMIKFPGLQYGIIDFYFDLKINLPEPPVLTYFKTLKSQLSPKEFEQINIAFICISHTDKDHIKGIKQTIDWFDENGVFIEEFWFGAARSQEQFMGFLDDKINEYMEKLPESRHGELLSHKKFYNKNLTAFFKSFEKWKSGGFNSARYRNEEIGKGDYLSDIRPLRNPTIETTALNVGPLSVQLDDYYKNLTEDVVTKIICGKSKDDTDKNDISHILCIKFGAKTLIFGGDTHKDIWEECLDQYHDPRYRHEKLFGPLKGDFIKVSHHGSKNSSSPKIWREILSDNPNSFLGISSGRNLKYKHPNSETIQEIRATQSGTLIFPTNICGSCLNLLNHAIEQHLWYRDLKVGTRRSDNPEHSDIFGFTSLFKKTAESTQKQYGLLAYIFEIAPDEDTPVKVRVALSAVAKTSDCFYISHDSKFCKDCELAAKL